MPSPWFFFRCCSCLILTPYVMTPRPITQNNNKRKKKGEKPKRWYLFLKNRNVDKALAFGKGSLARSLRQKKKHLKKTEKHKMFLSELMFSVLVYKFKFMGVWKTPGNPHRRLDLIGVPWSELACAHIYFDSGGRKTSRRKGQVAYKPPKRRASTLWKGQVLNSGTIFDAIYVCSTACWQRAFNRSLRLLARRLGGSLSQHALQMDVSRDMQDQATKLTEGAQMAEYTSNEHKGNLQTGRKNNVEKLLQHPHAFVC
eukprot:m.195227 g.195227  ORF g.195227 m.195227 type:complete len:256 (+) comp18310_c0_seq9:1632-2399(+)